MPSKANYTLNTSVTATDRASRVYAKMEHSFKKMTGSVKRESRVAGDAFKRFSRTIARSTKRAAVSMSNLNARINKLGRNAGKKLGFLGKLGLTVGISAALLFMKDAVVSLDTNLASLSAITGITGDAFKDFEKEIDAVSKSEKIFAADTAKAFELVGSAKPELLSSAKALGQVATSAITLSKASGDELAGNVAALTNVLNQFGLEADQSTRAMNVLAAASVVGDTKIMQTSEAFKAAGSEAKLSGLNIEELSGAIATFSKFGFKAAEAGTKFRNILSKMSLGDALPKDALRRLKAAGVDIDLISDKTVPFMSRLKELSKIQNNSAALAKTFGAENKGAAAILLNNLPLLEANIKGVTGTAAASEQAAIKTNTLAVKWQEMTAVFKNAITSTDSENKSLQFLKNAIGFVTRNMNIIIPIIGSLVAALIVFKVVMMAVNFVMMANPITWIILGIMALIAAIVALVVYWDEVKAALQRFWDKIKENLIVKFLLFPFRLMIGIIRYVIDNFDELKTSISNLWTKLRENLIAKILLFPLFAMIDIVKYVINNFDKLKTSISNFWNKIKESPITKFLLKPILAVIDAVKFLIKGFKKVVGFFGGDTEIKSQGPKIPEIEDESQVVDDIIKENKQDKLIESLDKNTNELDENTKASKKEWKGRFTTSILRDANIPSTAIKTAQREIAISGMAQEFKNTSLQKSIINNNNTQSVLPEVVTPFSGSTNNSQSNSQSNNKNSGSNQQLAITIIDKTGGKFGVEVESTGVEVNTTGN